MAGSCHGGVRNLPGRPVRLELNDQNGGFRRNGRVGEDELHRGWAREGLRRCQLDNEKSDGRQPDIQQSDEEQQPHTRCDIFSGVSIRQSVQQVEFGRGMLL